LKRMNHVIKKYKSGELDEEKMVQSIACIVAHVRYFCPNTSITLEAGAE